MTALAHVRATRTTRLRQAALCGARGHVDAVEVAEVAEVAEPHQEGRGGSSTMPQKRNPISCEYILAQSRGVHALVPPR